MIIEQLYPEIANQFGDTGNVRYLCASDPNARLTQTSSFEVPNFIRDHSDLLVIGAMSEQKQPIVRDALKRFRHDLRQYIADGGAALFTGSAIELLGEYVEQGNEKIPMLGLYPFTVERHFDRRRNTIIYGEYHGMKIVGVKSQFACLHGPQGYPFIHIIKGYGNGVDDPNEGLKDNNLYATYLLGPLLVENPPLARELLGIGGYHGPLAFERQAMQAYEEKTAHMARPDAQVELGAHGN